MVSWSRGAPPTAAPWASSLESDLGVSVADLQQAFFTPYWSEIVVGKAALEDYLRPALATIAPHICYEKFVAYWFANDALLNNELLDELSRQRRFGRKVFLATNQEHLRAAHLLEQLALKDHIDGIYYSAALGCRKPDRSFFEKVATHSGFSPKQLLLADDTLANVVAAQSAGWKAMLWAENASAATLSDALSGDAL